MLACVTLSVLAPGFAHAPESMETKRPGILLCPAGEAAAESDNGQGVGVGYCAERQITPFVPVFGDLFDVLGI